MDPVHHDDLGRPDSRTAPRPWCDAAGVGWPGWLVLGLASFAVGAAALAAEGPGAATPASMARSEHWAYQPVRDAIPPMQRVADWPVANGIDAFLEASRQAKGLRSSAEADRRTLIRRVTFDLVGLPPEPAEIEAFINDRAPLAYERLVDRLLASPHFGERWARHWLDTVRYTESQGFEYDRLRDRAWHYRDYVIDSFNRDLPYDRFMMEQVAGDVLRPVMRDGIVATSLLVCGPWDEAGSAQANLTQRAATREEEMEDLVSVVGQTFLGLTVNCARCHAHKFDPISQEDYFRLKAVFDGVKHGERPIEGEGDAQERADRLARWRAAAAAAAGEVASWEAEAVRRRAAQSGDAAVAVAPWPRWRWDFGRTNSPLPAGRLHGGAKVEQGALALPKDGAWFESEPLDAPLSEKTLEAWVSLADLEQGGGAAIAVESPDGRAFDAIVFGEREPKRWTAGSEGFVRTRDLGQPVETASASDWIHMAAVYGAEGTVALYRNGEPYGLAYRPDAPPVRHAVGAARVVLGLRHTGGGRPWLRGRVRSAAVHDRALSADEVLRAFRSAGAVPSETEIEGLLTLAERGQWRAARARRAEAREALSSMASPPVCTRVQPPPTRRLLRGDVTKPAEEMSPGGLSAVVDVDADFGLTPDAPESERRLRFARWLADPRHPLPARVMMYRLWHLHFGQGLVATPNDFGVAGARPTHPELLDWLATQFARSGWSLKSMHRLMVTSAAYRQASVSRREALGVDADNQWLWRFSPRRVEAEALRDAMLAASGRLNREMGGVSTRPFEVLTFPANAYLPVDRVGAAFDRRTVYRMNVNSGKDPMLDAFDCPDPAVKTPRRGVTTTPLQALSLMNGSFVQRQASHLARRAWDESPKDARGAIRHAYQWALGRPPTPAETERALEAERARGLASVCWALLNSTEFVYVQ